MSTAELQPLPHDQAVAALTAFFVREGFPVDVRHVAERAGPSTVLVHDDLGPLRNFRGGLGHFWVSPRGAVVQYSGAGLRAAPAPVDAKDAIALAQAFLERHVPALAQRSFALQPVEVAADAVRLRWIEQPRRDVEALVYPNVLEVAVALPAGRITRFYGSDLRLSRATLPAITREQARARIRALFAKASVESIELLLVPGPDGREAVTVWSAMVMVLTDAGPETRRVELDADTGAVVAGP